jgi:adenosine kinase
MRTQVAECQRFGLRHAYDPGQQVSNISGDDLRAGIQAAEVLIVNDYELGVLSDKTGLSSADLKSQIPIVITTLGKDGSVIEGSSVKTPIKVATAKPDKLIDPTGAGDGYRAGFLYGYLRQWELPTCGQLGSVVASFIIEHHGTQPEFTKQAIKQRYQDTFNQELRL